MAKYVLEQKYDMVVGDRLSSSYFEENKRPFHGIGNKLVRGSINFFFKNDIRDIMTGYRAFSLEFVKTYPVLSKGFEIETEMSIFAIVNNLAMKNHIIEYREMCIRDRVYEDLPAVSINTGQNNSTASLQFTNSKGQVVKYSQLTKKQKRLWQDYKLVQYDLTAGKQYLYQLHMMK